MTPVTLANSQILRTYLAGFAEIESSGRTGRARTKMAVEAIEPRRRPPSSSSPRPSTFPTPRLAPAPFDPSPSASSSGGYHTSTSFLRLSSGTGTGTSSHSSSTFLSSFRHSLPDNPVIYDFAELRSATNNFLSKPRHSSSSSSPDTLGHACPAR